MGKKVVNVETCLRAYVSLQVSCKQVCLGVAHVSIALVGYVSSN